jgi:hypothetical protein
MTMSDHHWQPVRPESTAASRQPYKGYVLVATADKIRDKAIWHARVGIDRLIQGSRQVVPIDPGLGGKEFTSVADALSAALAHGRWYVDGMPPA